MRQIQTLHQFDSLPPQLCSANLEQTYIFLSFNNYESFTIFAIKTNINKTYLSEFKSFNNLLIIKNIKSVPHLLMVSKI
ncbi:hypothetical protein THIOM_000104 [Candidatus Thiomargarita nelsonii]|uniref:Uncharacterized protein n=1 Tax=Candidatus Thiomargarita nelsonii TaxID=1003181 RepID=A0A176S7P1_9GAMM|nr:hypothetical protein THIOM_000104 [Candidatus Thiomargarita nelsonii]